MKKGIDISAWQGDVDFSKVKASGVDFVILREGSGTNTDRQFFTYVKGCRDAGIPILGIYHFSYALNEFQAQEEAKLAVANAERAGLGENVYIFFDFEYDTVNKATAAGVRLSRKECVAHTRRFCEYVASLHRATGIYCNIDYYRNWYDGSLLSRFPLWLAYWNGQNTKPPYDCKIHQYTSKGSVPGISGNVDLNLLYEEEKPKSEEAKKTVEELAEEVLDGKWGNGEERKIALTEAGYDYAEVQKLVNAKVLSKKPTPTKSIGDLVTEVIQGKWGNGAQRKKALTEAGYNYAEIQARVNAFYSSL